MATTKDIKVMKTIYKGFVIKHIEGLKYQVEGQPHLTFTTIELAKKFIDDTFKRHPASNQFSY